MQKGHRYRRRYTVAAVILSAGAPLGLLLLRMFALELPVSSIAGEIRSMALVYAYISGATMVVFALFGWVLGRETDELERLSTIDALTGLHNRRALIAHLDREFNRSRRYTAPLSVLLIDVDHLKRINDTRGHAAGDLALRSVATSIAITLRDADIGGRWGGDEFLIIAPNTAGTPATRLAERLRIRLAGQGSVGTARTTVSVGVATFDPQLGGLDTREALLQAADGALFRAKAAGRNQASTGGMDSQVGDGPQTRSAG